MQTTPQDLERERLLELGRNDPEKLVARYRQIADMEPDETLPLDLNYAEMIDEIVTAKVPVYRRRRDRWK